MSGISSFDKLNYAYFFFFKYFWGFISLSVQYLEHGLAILVHITPPTPGFEPGPWMSEGS
jgi:hypothetical protein